MLIPSNKRRDRLYLQIYRKCLICFNDTGNTENTTENDTENTKFVYQTFGCLLKLDN